MKKTIVVSLFSLFIFCSKNDSDSANNLSATSSGSLVYTGLARINEDLVRAVKVLNLTTKKVTLFETDDFVFDGASVSKNGLVAQLFDRGRDEAIIRINKLDGTFVKQFVYSEDNSFATSGARISPDGKVVAFGLRVQVAAGDSRQRVYFCGTGENNDCYYYENLGDPEWLPDGRLIAVNVYQNRERGGLYATEAPLSEGNQMPTDVFRIGPETLDNAEEPVVTPDGKTIMVGLGVLQNIYAIDIQTKAVKKITTNGIQQFKPAVSNDGKTLFYIQDCCPVSASAPASLPTIHTIPLQLNATTSTPISTNYLKDAAGDSVNASGHYGYTNLTIP
jgi:WD40-like Beta Propeller Repeat